MASDIELVNRIRAGDRSSLGELYERYFPVLWRYASSQLWPDEAAARDVVSESFLAAMRSMNNAGPDFAKGSVIAWLMGIARHKIADFHRGRKPLPKPPGNTTGNHDPAQPMQRQETRIAIAQVMAKLNDEERLALEWKYLEGLSVKEIADRLGRSDKAAEALLFRGREEFRKRYQTMLDRQEK